MDGWKWRIPQWIGFFSDDDTVQKATNLNEWVRLLNEATHKFGKELDVARHHKQWMIGAGFKNVRDDVYKVCLQPPRPQP